ncbi:MAG: MOSC domain-containing protein [Candidatus Marinarcus sp.]|uniref:MOSC domain-containing protein n=1 Tax=Candidatus Marinarcus sp. TaxID=3100987 RepID=UPI003B000495
MELFSASKNESSLPRPIRETLELIVGHGIKNDKFAGKDENKAVMAVGKKAYEIAFKNGINLELGSLGENILLDFDPHLFETGSLIYIGETQLQITEQCSVCNHLALFDQRLPELVKAHRGLYLKVLKGGKIRKDSTVYVKEKI